MQIYNYNGTGGVGGGGTGEGYSPNEQTIVCDVGVAERRLIYVDAFGVAQLATNTDTLKKATAIVVKKLTTTSAVIVEGGFVGGFTGLDPTKDYFLGVDGAIVDTTPYPITYEQFVGKPVSPELLSVDISDQIIAP